MPLRNLRFLVVEDHEFQRFALKMLLHNLGASAVHLADNGHAALELIRAPGQQLDIVITDLSMPGMDGMEFIAHLGRTHPDLSLIVSSALQAAQMASVAAAARACGVNLLGTISKPLSAATLTPLIDLHRALRGDAAEEAP